MAERKGTGGVLVLIADGSAVQSGLWVLSPVASVRDPVTRSCKCPWRPYGFAVANWQASRLLVGGSGLTSGFLF